MTDALLPGSLRTAADLFGKLIRDTEVFEAGVNSDRLFNFVVTGHSLVDWIKNDPSVPAAAKSETEIAALHANEWLAICGDLATAAKHFSITRRQPVTEAVTTARGFGVGRFGAGPFGVGEEQITVHLPNGEAHSFLALVHGVVYAWMEFFGRHDIAVDLAPPWAPPQAEATDG